MRYQCASYERHHFKWVFRSTTICLFVQLNIYLLDFSENFRCLEFELLIEIYNKLSCNMCSIESSEARLSLTSQIFDWFGDFFFLIRLQINSKRFQRWNIQYKSIFVKIHYWKVHKQGDDIFQKDSLTHCWVITKILDFWHWTLIGMTFERTKNAHL